MVSGPVQKTSDAVTKPSMNRARSAESEEPESRRCNQPPTPSTRCSRRSSDPTMPPITSDPSTIRRGACGPTFAARAGSLTATADSPAISSVTRPSASVTRSRVRAGRRLPASTPIEEPTSTVHTLTAVPKPVITGLLGQGGVTERSLPTAALTGGPESAAPSFPEVQQMSRSSVTLRDATLADVEHLAVLWQPFLRRDVDTHLNDLATVIEQVGDRPGERLVVAEYDGEFAGAVYLLAAAYSPVNPEPVLQ